MRDIHTIADLRPHVIAISHADRTITLTQDVFEQIGDYTRSQPTGAVSGPRLPQELHVERGHA